MFSIHNQNSEKKTKQGRDLNPVIEKKKRTSMDEPKNQIQLLEITPYSINQTDASALIIKLNRTITAMNFPAETR